MWSRCWTVATFFCLFLRLSTAIDHGTNLIWAQSPPLGVISQSRIVAISGNPQTWVIDRNLMVKRIGAPHYTWEFSALDFHWDDQILYWSENTMKTIQGLTLNQTRETVTVVSGTSSEVHGIAVDWLSGNLYYTDAIYNWILMAPTKPGTRVYRMVVDEGLDNPHGIAVHPAQGRLFWSDWGIRKKIETSDLLGSNRRILVERDMVEPKGLTVDYQSARLYWVDSAKMTIEMVNIDGSGRTVMHQDEGSNFYGLTIYDDLIFATDRGRGGLLKVFNQKQKLVTFTLSKKPYDITMYDKTRQPGNSTACDDLDCQHFCVLDPVQGPSCLCGVGGILDPTDNRTCTISKKFSHPSHIYAIGDSICLYPANIADMSLTNVTLDSQCFLEGRQGYMTLTFDARNHLLFFFGNNTKTISRVPLQFGGKGTVLTGGTGTVHGMSFDWVNSNLYWTDITHGVIRMCSQDCSYQSVLIDRLASPFGIVVHPGRQTIYWTSQGHPPDIEARVESAHMDTTNRKVIMDRNLGKPNHLFIDFKEDSLYWTDSRLNHIRKMDIESGYISVFLQQPGVQFFGISLYQDYVLWTDRDDLNGIHIARKDNKKKVRGIIHPKNGVAADLITFDARNQPMFESPCMANATKCSQICVVTSPITSKCLCASGYKLDDDGFSCKTAPVTDNFLLVNDAFSRQIIQINLLNGVPSAVDLHLDHQPVALTYDPYDNKVFWSDNHARVVAEATVEGRYEKIVLRFNKTALCNGLAADYINRLLFYTDPGNNIVGVVSMLNHDMTAVLVSTDLDEPRDIVVYPRGGTLYWTDWGKKPRIEMAAMDGSGREDLVVFDGVSWPNGLALDAKDQNLYWVDAYDDTIKVMDLQTRKVTLLQTVSNSSHFFSVSLIGQYLYINDWHRNYLMRMDKKGGPLKRFGDTEFTRLLGMEGFNSSEAFKGPSVCAYSACEHLCLPGFKGGYTCRCSEGYVSNGIECEQAPSTTTTPVTTTTTTTTTTPTRTTTTETAATNTRTNKTTTATTSTNRASSSPSPDVITKVPPVSSSLSLSTATTKTATTTTTSTSVTTTISRSSSSSSTSSSSSSSSTSSSSSSSSSTSSSSSSSSSSIRSSSTSSSSTSSSSIYSSKSSTRSSIRSRSSTSMGSRPTTRVPRPDTSSERVGSTTTGSSVDAENAQVSGKSGSSALSTSTIAIIIIGVSVVVIIIIITIVLIVVYKRRHRSYVPHDRLEESRSSSIQRIAFSSSDDDHVTFDGGFDNPTYDCLNTL